MNDLSKIIRDILAGKIKLKVAQSALLQTLVNTDYKDVAAIKGQNVDVELPPVRGAVHRRLAEGEKSSDYIRSIEARIMQVALKHEPEVTFCITDNDYAALQEGRMTAEMEQAIEDVVADASTIVLEAVAAKATPLIVEQIDTDTALDAESQMYVMETTPDFGLAHATLLSKFTKDLAKREDGEGNDALRKAEVGMLGNTNFYRDHIVTRESFKSEIGYDVESVTVESAEGFDVTLTNATGKKPVVGDVVSINDQVFGVVKVSLDGKTITLTDKPTCEASDVVKFYGDYKFMLICNRNAGMFVNRPHQAVDADDVILSEAGVSLRVSNWVDKDTKRRFMRIDTLCNAVGIEGQALKVLAAKAGFMA